MERDFLARLARFGVKKIDAQGRRFDPNQHEALFEIPDETQPSGTVAQVVEQGYMIGERVLRPAKVGVARGGSKPSWIGASRLPRLDDARSRLQRNANMNERASGTEPTVSRALSARRSITVGIRSPI